MHTTPCSPPDAVLNTPNATGSPPQPVLPVRPDAAPADPARRRWLAASSALLLTPGLAPQHALAGVPAAVPAAVPALPARVRTQLQALVDDPVRPLASLSVLVLRAGRVVHEGQFGRRWIDPSGAGRHLPVSRHTLFRIASISKLLVALGVMRLVEAGRLNLDADIGELLGWRLRHPAHPTVPLTVRLLLSHRSGLRDAAGTYVAPGQTLAAKLLPGGAAFGEGRCWSPAAQAPGQWFEYCNLNYVVLASVMEKASGQRFDQLMAEQVLQPLGMAGGFEASQFSEAELAQVATLYRKRATDDDAPWNTAGPWVVQTDDFGGRRPAPPPGLDGYELGSNGSLFGPQGRLRTRVADLGTVLTMLADEGRHAGRAFLQPASVQALMTEHWRYAGRDAPNGDDLGGEFQAWGLGLQHFIDRSLPDSKTGRRQGDRLTPRGGQLAWGHLGFAYGLMSGLMLDPARRSGIVYAIGGTGADPAAHPGRHASYPLWEERLHELLWGLTA